MSAVRLSLVMASVGRADEVGRLLDSLLAQTAGGIEWIVADQNADDRLRPHLDRARDAGLPVQHLRLARPNLSAARNAGIAVARGRWVAFPDDDCWYEPDTVAQLLDVLARQPGWQGAVIDWVEQSRSHAQPSGHAVDADADPRLSLPAWRRFRGGDASSIALVLDAALLRTLGGFDERLGVGQRYGAAEETDLVLRALAAGAVIGRVPQARVHHHHPGQQPPREVDWRRWRQAMARGRGTGALYAKHRLAWAVRLRGLVGPSWQACRAGQGWPGLWLALATAAGRLQGALSWWWSMRDGAGR
ncbi:glycosyltransferase family 2 protein [Leptothrix sp. BB-4]